MSTPGSTLRKTTTTPSWRRRHFRGAWKAAAPHGRPYAPCGRYGVLDPPAELASALVPNGHREVPIAVAPGPVAHLVTLGGRGRRSFTRRWAGPTVAASRPAGSPCRSAGAVTCPRAARSIGHHHPWVEQDQAAQPDQRAMEERVSLAWISDRRLMDGRRDIDAARPIDRRSTRNPPSRNALRAPRSSAWRARLLSLFGNGPIRSAFLHPW